MKQRIYVASMLSAALFLAACEGDDGINGTDGADGTDGFNSLIAIRDIPKGDPVCLGGGRAADSGLDTHRTADPLSRLPQRYLPLDLAGRIRGDSADLQRGEEMTASLEAADKFHRVTGKAPPDALFFQNRKTALILEKIAFKSAPLGAHFAHTRIEQFTDRLDVSRSNPCAKKT